ncbi:MAG: TonB C-terminal domain-containing protein [Nitrospinae bacterium]|nr:TonB C-terminal domain-containing protein [Nitrospinota bacterium]
MVKDLRPKKPSAINGSRAESEDGPDRHGMSGEISGALILSALAHSVLFAALLFLAPYVSSTRLAFTPAYTVNLVDLPAGGGSGGGTPPPEAPQPQAKKPDLPRTEKPVALPPKPEMTLPAAKVKEPLRREEKKPEPPARPTPEKTKEVRPPGKPAASIKREPERPVTVGTGPPGAGPSGSLALGTGGGVLSLDTANFPFTYYLRQVTDRIEQNWLRPQENVGRVVVYFRIKRDGTILEPQLYESSRNQAVDLLAAGAVKRSEPFPPLPVEFGGDYLGIYLCFGMGALCPGQREG